MLILIITIITVLWALSDIKKNYQRLIYFSLFFIILIYRLQQILHEDIEVEVLRDGVFIKESSINLYPGDIISIQNSQILPCDCLLLEGQRKHYKIIEIGDAICDEAILTGESLPITKHPLSQNEQEDFSFKKNQENLILSGTKILKIMNQDCNEKELNSAIGLVYATGFQTFKGQLAKGIIFQKRERFNFFEDSAKYLIILAILPFIAMIFLLPTLLENQMKTPFIILLFLELITISVPPALPIALQAGISYSLYRLNKLGISCLHPETINVAGKVTTICFDKTGTLTESGLKLKGFLLPQSEQEPLSLTPFIDSPTQLEEKNQETVNNFLVAIQNCHQLVNLNDEIVGDTLELEIQKFFHISVDNKQKKIWEFKAELRRMCVIKDKWILVKGAPEAIIPLCNNQKYTALEAAVEKYSQQGYRVLALASKFVEDETFEGLARTNREQLERELKFAGLLIFENKLKDPTTPTIQYLKKNSKMNMAIITGDNPLTAISVGKQCGIIPNEKIVVLLTKENEEYKWKYIFSMDESTNCLTSEDPLFDEKQSHICFAITGNCLDEFFRLTNQNEQLLKQTLIYARMTPNQKALIIERLKSQNETVMMCGDGANDCEAMNKADVSLSLNEGEASLAASFTSQIQQDISSVLCVLKEGRCSLATSISSFKFMTLYSLIQFISVVILYSSCSDFMTPHYILIDIFLLIPLIFTMNRFGPADNLSKHSVPHNLVSLEILSNVLGHVTIVVFFQYFMFWLLSQQPWFIEYKELVSKKTLINYDVKRGFESTVLCWFSCFQYITCAICVCEGKPFRETIYKSFLFLFNIFLGLVLVIFIIIESSEKDITQTFEFKKVPVKFATLVLQIAFLNMGISYLFELGQRRIFAKQ